jgi:RNA polymerase sigma-70 factor (ECF subfamily)
MDTHEDVEDLSQEIIAQLWRSFGTFRNESNFSTWMYKVALNTAITYFRKGKRKLPYEPLHEESEMIADQHSPDNEQRLQSFYKAVHELNNIEKAIIFLYLEDQSHKEIAEKMGISEVHARVKLTRIKDKLQNIIKKQQNEP